MAIGSPPITWDLKHTGEPWVYIGTPLPNPSGNTGVMVCMYVYETKKPDSLKKGFYKNDFQSPDPLLGSQSRFLMGHDC